MHPSQGTLSREAESAGRAGGRRPSPWRRVAAGVLALAALVGLGGGVAGALDPWEAETPAPYGRAGVAGGVIDGLCYVAGGQIAVVDCTYGADLQIFDPVARTWTLGPSMLQRRTGPAGAVLGGKLYVAGGGTGCGPIANSVEAYDPASQAWTSVAPMLTARIGAAAAAVAGKIYVFGGHTGSGGFLTSAEAYDPASNTWVPRAPMPRARLFATAVELGGVIYVLGGYDATTNFLEVDVYDPVSNSWSLAAPLPASRAGPAAAALDGILYVSSGQGVLSQAPISSVIAYDPAVETWHEVAPLGTPRMHHLMFSAAGRLYVCAGLAISGGQASLLTSAERYLPPADTNDPPTASAGPDQAVDATSSGGAEVSLDGTASDDPDGDALTFQWNVSSEVVLDDPTSATPTGTFPVGVHMVTLTVSDGQGGFDTDDVVIEVEDVVPPQVGCTTDVASLWPPNHRMVEVQVWIEASDAVSDPADLLLSSVTIVADELDDATGDGDGSTTGDVHGEDGQAEGADVTTSFSYDAATASFVGTVRLRAERSGAGDGRSYGIAVVVEDASGNEATTSCVVVVPLSRRR